MTLFLKPLDDRVLLVDTPARPGAGWLPGTTLQAAVDRARAGNAPLFILPCSIATGPITVGAPGNGGAPFRLMASPGTVTLRLSSPAPYLILCDDVADVLIDGLGFDGGGQALTAAVGPAGPALVRVRGAGARTARIVNSVITRSAGSGLMLDGGASATVSACRITQCDIGLTSLDATVTVSGCTVRECRNNGIVVLRSQQGEDGAVIQNNEVGAIRNASGGTGQYGNGILVFRAGGVAITDNRIADCAFSAIRVNGGNRARVIANRIDGVREHAIYLEAPNAGLGLDGGVVASNIVTGAGVGVAVANFGLYGDGAAREVTVTGNQVFNVTCNPMSADYGPGRTFGAGIMVTGDTIVSGNTIDHAETAGIVLGTNEAATSLTCTGNFISHCPMGIGYSADQRAGPMLISSNLITGYRPIPKGGQDLGFSGAIVGVSYDGTRYRRTADTDYGNAGDQQVGRLWLGRNAATP